MSWVFVVVFAFFSFHRYAWVALYQIQILVFFFFCLMFFFSLHGIWCSLSLLKFSFAGCNWCSTPLMLGLFTPVPHTVVTPAIKLLCCSTTVCSFATVMHCKVNIWCATPEGSWPVDGALLSGAGSLWSCQPALVLHSSTGRCALGQCPRAHTLDSPGFHDF